MFCFKLRRTATETHKNALNCVQKQSSILNAYLQMVLKDSERTVRILEMIPRTGHPSPNDTQDQLQKLTNWWPETDIFTAEHGTKTLYRNTGNKATYAMQQHRRAKTSNTLQ